jgi:hypothetical protein
VLVAAAEHGALSLRTAVGAIDVSMAVFALAGVTLAGRAAVRRGVGVTAG